MKTKLTLIPSMMELIAGTYHGIDAYSPVHPSQKMPTTKLGPPSIAPKSRCSGGGNPFHFPIRPG